MPLPLIKLGLAAATGYFLLRQYRRTRTTGSTTNASDAMDDMHLPANPTLDQKLDEGVKETFPASDPVSIAHPDETAYEKQQRLKRRSS